MTRFRLYIIFALIVGIGNQWVWSDEVSEMDAPVVPKRERHRNIREKDAEGTEAKNRFEVDNLLKSQYHLDGKPLEVDTD
jgi:hypothetical protein